MRKFTEGKLEDVIQILREEMITMGTDVANAKTGQMWAFDAERLAKRICPLLSKPDYDNLLSIEKARESVPNEDCSGHKYSEDEKEDIARYMQFGAEIQLTIDTDRLALPKPDSSGLLSEEERTRYGCQSRTMSGIECLRKAPMKVYITKLLKAQRDLTSSDEKAKILSKGTPFTDEAGKNWVKIPFCI